MAAKKGRPALIELIDKGSTSTPGWFYGKKKSKLQQLHKGTAVTEPIATAVHAGGVRITSPTTEPVSDSAPGPTTCSAPEPVIRSAPKAWFELTDDKLVLSLSYWKVLPLVALGLVLTLSIAYRLGQSSVSGTNTTDDTNAATATANIDTKEPIKNIQIDNRTTAAEPGSAGKTTSTAGVSPAPVEYAAVKPGSVDKTTEKVEIKKAASGTATSAISPPQTGLCLIMCGHRDKSVLEPVRQYFNANGFATVVGLYGRGYVLVHAQPVQKTTSPEAAAIQQRVIELGNQYENDKPRGAPGFAAAWKSPYFVRTSDVQF